MNLSKLYRVLVLGSSVLVASACGADAPVGGGAKGDPATHSPVAAADPEDAGSGNAIDGGDDAGPEVLADAGTPDAGDDQDGGVNSWVSWI
jgi:hypothetical protein